MEVYIVEEIQSTKVKRNQRSEAIHQRGGETRQSTVTGSDRNDRDETRRDLNVGVESLMTGTPEVLNHPDEHGATGFLVRCESETRGAKS
jgi:hypothetical protein